MIEAIVKFEKNCKAYDEGVIRGIVDIIVDMIIKIEEKKKNKENKYRFIRVIIKKILNNIHLLKRKSENIDEVEPPKRKKID